jgi:acetyl esterase/lipase
MRTVTYCTDGGVPLAMSLFAPSASPRPVPVVVEIHGGGWQQGSRLLSLASSTTAADLVAAGIMVASVDYRLAPRDPWPDQIIDVECAVRFLRAHAADLGIEPDRIAALGTSAGGQLASLLGMAAVAHEWDQGPYLDQSSRVDVVVDQFGPADLTATDWPHDTAVMIRRVFGAYPTPANPVLKAASPVTYAAAADAPFLIVQGTDDQVVPLSQSEELASRLRAAGVPVQLVLVARGRHGLVTPGESPSPAAISTLITAYLSRALRH